uniref:Uncharacterized protein n=1 Tax=Arundo donax TaxID=35708 RepID=A0A0A9DV82_ARUDO
MNPHQVSPWNHQKQPDPALCSQLFLKAQTVRLNSHHHSGHSAPPPGHPATLPHVLEHQLQHRSYPHQHAEPKTVASPGYYLGQGGNRTATSEAGTSPRRAISPRGSAPAPPPKRRR